VAEDLTSKQRQFLKGRAHGMSPVVRIGKGGLTDAVIQEAKTALRAHELVKVRVDAEDGEERRALAERLAAEAHAQLVARVGKVAVLYRAREKDPGIRLPR
jgi:RNA-binding protein